MTLHIMDLGVVLLLMQYEWQRKIWSIFYPLPSNGHLPIANTYLIAFLAMWDSSLLEKNPPVDLPDVK